MHRPITVRKDVVRFLGIYNVPASSGITLVFKHYGNTLENKFFFEKDLLCLMASGASTIWLHFFRALGKSEYNGIRRAEQSCSICSSLERERGQADKQGSRHTFEKLVSIFSNSASPHFSKAPPSSYDVKLGIHQRSLFGLCG